MLLLDVMTYHSVYYNYIYNMCYWRDSKCNDCGKYMPINNNIWRGGGGAFGNVFMYLLLQIVLEIKYSSTSTMHLC